MPTALEIQLLISVSAAVVTGGFGGGKGGEEEEVRVRGAEAPCFFTHGWHHASFVIFTEIVIKPKI